MSRVITLVEAIQLALAQAMAVDDRVLVLGEDVGKNGGVFRATAGLLERFGENRVFDTPLAEDVIVGHSIGLAAQGFTPVAEIQFMGFIYPALDQLINHASRLRNRTRGRLTCPLVVRTPYGAGIHAPEHHSESTEALLTHVPGLRVVVPSSPSKAYGLLLAAIQSSDPVIFLEPSRLYRSIKEEVMDNGVPLPLDQSFLVQEGTDVTLIAWGAMVVEAQKAAASFAEEGVSCEIIDVATLSPFNGEDILKSVEKTGRCVIVHEAPLTNGFGAEIAAQIAEHALLSLLAPVIRVTAPDIIVPLARLEDYYIPSSSQIINAVHKVLSYS